MTAQTGYESYFLWYGAFPSKATTDWFPNETEMQGVANDNSNWYFTSTNLCLVCNTDGYGQIWKIPASIALNQPNIIGLPGVENLYYPHIEALVSKGYSHFGDPDYYEYQGAGYLVVPLTGTGGAPGIAFFKTNPLRFVNYAILDGVKVQEDKKFGPGKVYYAGDGICIGSISTATNHNYYTGRMDEMLLFNRGLSEAEATILAGKAIIKADEDLESGLIVHLPFANDDINDSPNSVESTDFQVYGGSFASSCSPAVMGERMKFLNGMDEYLSCGPSLQLPKFSLCFFLHTNSSKESVVAGWDSLGYQVMLNPKGSPGKLSVRLWISRTEILAYTSTESLNDGQCHHVAITFDGYLLKIYLDGVLKEEKSKGKTEQLVMYAGTQFYVGHDDDQAKNLWFQGKIDELRIYNRALDAKEVKKCQQGSSLPPIETVLVRWYDLRGAPSGGASLAGSFAVIYNLSPHLLKVTLNEKSGKQALPTKKVKAGEQILERLPARSNEYSCKAER